MISFDNEPTPSVLHVTQSEIEDFSHAEHSLHLGSKTLELAGTPDYREPGIIFGGRFSARCAMTEEDSPQAFTAQVVATVPSTIHSWFQRTFHRDNVGDEPVGYASVESWQEAASPILELVQ
jgi:hypothetical protein